MTNQRPLVSILTPSFNQGDYISDCIESIARQAYQPIEQIVMDGGSTDQTLDILRAAPEHVRWVSEPDRGQAHAVNKAFELSNGEVIGWLNSDDAYFLRDVVERTVEIFTTRPEIDVVYGDCLMVNEDRSIQRYATAHTANWTDVIYTGGHLACPICQPSTLIRRSAWEKAGQLGEDLHVTLDIDFWWRLHRNGARFMHVALPFGVDRDHKVRKVRTLIPLWQSEPLQIAEKYNLRLHYNAWDRARSWQRRWRGVRQLLKARAMNDTAFDVTFPSVARTLSNQLLVAQPTEDFRKQATEPVRPSDDEATSKVERAAS